MSCDAVAAAFLWLAAAGPTPAAPVSRPAEVSVASEPLFADIVGRARGLKAQVEAFRKGSEPVPEAFAQAITALAALDMQGHVTLAARGVDGDLKCILKGISQDLPLKLDAVRTAATPKDRDLALREMSYLLNDNIEVITAPPAPPV